MRSGLDEVVLYHRWPEPGGVMTLRPIPRRHATDEYQVIVRGELSHRFPTAFEA
jgi:metal-dependent amidase/aminoacylase/carboxypeptidase family protein